MSNKTKNRTKITAMLDYDLLDEFRTCFPGLNQSAQITIAIQRFIEDVKDKKITLDDILGEIQRVNERRVRRD